MENFEGWFTTREIVPLTPSSAALRTADSLTSHPAYRLLHQVLDLPLRLVQEGLSEHGAGQLDRQLAVQTQGLTGAQGGLGGQAVQAPANGGRGRWLGAQGAAVGKVSGAHRAELSWGLYHTHCRWLNGQR